MEPEAHDDKEDFPDPTIEMVREILRKMH